MEEQQAGRAVKIPAVFLRAEQGSVSLPRIFTEKGISFLEYPLYELEVQEKKRAAAIGKEPDYLVFGSAMGVRTYFEGMEQAGLENTKSRYVCIGKLCGEELKKHTGRSFLTAQESSVEGIVEGVCRDVGNKTYYR
ncbi:MAG: uroporphyrinogen-III synthase [Lachnospiraceae bacterium]|nr:uroporphyrinogen-III synthase [Lachnospiraceae bacterium]